KIQGLTMDILEQALEQAKEGRIHILGEMMKALSEPRPQLKPNAPKLVTVTIPKEFIGAVIGPGGKIIQELQKETETTISIEENDEVGVVEIAGVDQAGIDAAIARIKQIAFVPEVGETYDAIVKSIKPFGAFVEISKGTEGLVHISEIEHRRLNTVEEVLKLGDKIKVKLMGYDEKGKM